MADNIPIRQLTDYFREPLYPLTSKDAVIGLQEALNNKYEKPVDGIPSTDMTQAVQNSLQKANESVSKTVNDLVNYYLKSETYTQTEVNNLIGSISLFHFEVYPDLASVTDPSSNVLYLIGPSGSGSDMYEEYVYANSNFVKIGDTSIDLSGYVTVSDLNTALASYTTTTDLQTYYAQKDGEYNELHAGYSKFIDGNDSTSEPVSQFTFRKSGGGNLNLTTQHGVIDKIQGNSVAWNQLISNGDFSSNTGWNANGVSLSISDNVATIVFSGNNKSIFANLSNAVPNHKYYFRYHLKASAQILCGYGYGSKYVTKAWNVGTDWGLFSAIDTANDSERGLYLYCSSSEEATLYANNFCLIDLTLLGIDNLTTVAEVEAWLASNVGLRDYYPYNAGELINCKVQGIKTVGFNQWDEEWELGTINAGTGQIAIDSDDIRSKNYVPVFPNTEYYFRSKSDSQCNIAFYDENKNYISYARWGQSANVTFTTPANVRYLKFGTWNGYGTTYNNDICINLSNTTKNGTYEPYWTETKPFDVTKIYGKLNGEGSLVQCFPNGMLSAGSVHDVLIASEAVVKIGSVDLGTLRFEATGTSGHLLRSTEISDTVKIPSSTSVTSNIIHPKYIAEAESQINAVGEMAVGSTGLFYLYVADNSITTESGYLNYELATPLEYTGLMYEVSTGVYEPFNLPLGYMVSEYGTEQQVFPEPIPPSDNLTSVSGILDLTYDVVDGLEFIKNTDDRLGDLDYRASRVEDRLDDVDSEIDDLKIPLQSSMPSGGMLPNVVYNLGTLSSNTTFTLAAPTDNTILNHYYWTFDIGSTVPTLTWPTGIIWAGDNLSPIIEANKHYEVSVINNIGTYIYSVVI